MTDSVAAWERMAAHRDAIAGVTMRQLFDSDPRRFDRFSLEAAGLLLDYSKNRMTADTVALLLELAQAAGLIARRDAMFAGQPVNSTEGRAALHIALRNRSGTPLLSGGVDVMPAIQDVLVRMARIVAEVRGGVWRGHDGQTVTDVVHLGIGGSDLGPRFVCEALAECAATDGHTGPRLHFVANVDATELLRTLQGLDAARTLFIVASKTFTTLETMMNARSARAWCIAHGVAEASLQHHFLAVSANVSAAREFGIADDHILPFWDWVGGRYSLWSAIGLPIALRHGMDHFHRLLDGAHAMDRHFASAPLAGNMPVLLALVGIWNANLLGAKTLCIAPYSQALERFPAYLQQLEMESNGKSVHVDGAPLHHATVPVVWGQPGTNAQHAYFQALHQGTDWAPVDFVAVLRPNHEHIAHQRALLANCFAQSQALMRGKTLDEARDELLATGKDRATADRLAPHRSFPGNRPSNTLLLPRLDPFHLGALLALYEHKVFVQAALWDINPFDQWGVELGKHLAQRIENEMQAGEPGRHDASTAALTSLARQALSD